MNRNNGLDFLRLLSMLMVTVLHLLAQGGVLYATQTGSPLYWTLWFLEIACYCAVNCFALITGYGMSQAQPKLSRLLKLWFHTAFYSLLGLLLFLVFKPDAVSKRTVLQALMPITSGRYWYISAYFGVLILMPLLNTVLRHTERRTLGTILLLAFAVFCVLPVVTQENPFKLDSGYSMMWLCLLYLTGGYLRKYDILSKVKPSHALCLVVGMPIITFLSKFILETWFLGIPALYGYRHALISYISPTVVLVALGLVALCSKLRFGPVSATLVRRLSPAALGVYLTHSHPLVWKHLLKGFSANLAQYPFFGTLCLIASATFLIYAAGLAMDLLRIQLFKWLHIDALCARLEEKLTTYTKKA